MADFTHVDQYLAIGQEAGASDIHLGVNAPPIWRLQGILQPIWTEAPRLTAEETTALADGFLPEAQKASLAKRGDADFAYATDFGRFRTSVVRQRLGTDLVFRIINTQVRTMDELGLPEHLKLLTRYQNGLILVTGSVGSGKSTTLAALVEQVNLERREHIITLEDPIEYIFEAKGCHITQREVGTHTVSFSAALRGALREDPDVIMIGEMRDLETISLAITAAETGHLVLGTLHTGNAARTLDRLLDVFPVDQQEQIRIMVSESLRGIISQQLIPRMDGTGRALALETLTNTPAVANVIREAKTFMLPGIIQTGKKQGMQLMDDALTGLFDRQVISGEEAYARSEQKEMMRRHIEALTAMAYIDQFLAIVVEHGASDLHIGEGQPPKMRQHGDIAPIRAEAITREEAAYMLSEIAGPENWALFEERGDLDFAYEMDQASRFRCNFLKQANGYGAVFRLIPTKIATLEQLGIPPVVKEFGHLRGGLVLVTGPTGSGKSTTLAALIDYVNENFSRHIVTIEEPIEFVHDNKRSVITQREVPVNTESFPTGLKAALREDADIVLVGEMRDLETISLALTAAGTGLLVFGTLHTNNARKTVDRMVDVFPANKQAQARTMLANYLRGVLAQLLLKKADGSGRVAVNEILISNPAVSAIIREGATQKLQDVIVAGKGQGMQFMDDAIWALLQQGVVSPHEAFMKAIDKNLFKKFLPAEEQDLANSAGSAPNDEKRGPGNFVKGKSTGRR